MHCVFSEQYIQYFGCGSYVTDMSIKSSLSALLMISILGCGCWCSRCKAHAGCKVPSRDERSLYRLGYSRIWLLFTSRVCFYTLKQLACLLPKFLVALFLTHHLVTSNDFIPKYFDGHLK